MSTWMTVAKKGNDKPHNPLGDSHLLPQHLWLHLPPAVLMQLDPGRPGPGNLIMFPHRVSNVSADELVGQLLDLLVSEFTDKRPKSKEPRGRSDLQSPKRRTVAITRGAAAVLGRYAVGRPHSAVSNKSPGEQ
jgi:hypothetical protein